jgi:CHASE1-domain containing sensor protein
MARKRRSTPVRVVAAFLVFLVTLLASYALWTVYENTLTPAALDQGSPMNTKPSPRGELSLTAARALKAYGGQAA